ncbi:MAG: DNA alkylation repair protein [Alphaproteobacteria bacterium]|nr:DNA alkylation repair protein [Alphaproteobacteria bacterium]
MRTKILNTLQQQKEEEYKNFSLKLLPKDTKLLGVRIPIIKKLAKDMLKSNQGELYLSISLDEFVYQEEKMLYSLLIAYEKTALLTKINRIKKYVPYIKNWSECDTFCAALKDIKENQEDWYKEMLLYLDSSKEYEIRFFYVIALNYFISDTYLPRILEAIKTQKYFGFYDRMAVAWFLSMAFVKYENEIRHFLKNTSLDSLVYQKTISKIKDSYQIKQKAKQDLISYLAQVE